MNQLTINTDRPQATISRHLYGHFAEHLGRCIYEGLWVGEDSPIPNTRGIRNDVVAALRALKMPNLRWPGGCFADTYHWKDGIGPREDRPSIVNVHWGGTTENNHFGTHEFLDLCALLECEPYICGNVGSGTVQEMAEWIEYLTMPGKSPMADLRRKNGHDDAWPLTYWGVGNENWGCGGNMTALQYAWEYRKYQGYCRHFGSKKLYKVACGFDDAWNEILVREAHQFMDGLSIHHYTVPGPWAHKGSATDFTGDEWAVTMKKAWDMDALLDRTEAILLRHDPKKRIGIVVDEWGTWFDVEPGTNPGFLYQQNTIRDALVAGLTFHIFHDHAERVHVANIAQLINVLQAMILTDGPQIVLTPTYHVFEMFNVHHDATRLDHSLTASGLTAEGTSPLQLSASASRDAKGTIHISLCNLSATDSATLTCSVRGQSLSGEISGRILTGPATNSHNTFDAPNTVQPEPFTAFQQDGDNLTIDLPARSVVVLALRA